MTHQLPPTTDLDTITSIFTGALSERRGTLSDEEVRRLLAVAHMTPGDAVATPGSSLRCALAFIISNSREFGMTLRVGLTAEAQAHAAGTLAVGQAVVSAAVALTGAGQFLGALRDSYAYRSQRAAANNTDVGAFDEQLDVCVATLLELASYYSPGNDAAPCVIEELRINALTPINGRLVAFEVSCRVGEKTGSPAARPIEKIDRLLHPRSIGIIGASASKMNFGRIILKNLIDSGYPREQMIVIRPGENEIDGVPCGASLAALEHKLDLLIVAVAADAVFGLVDEIIATGAAQSVILIPGGLGETQASVAATAAMNASINTAHASADGGPIFLGGNCLGVVSHPGGYDSWFIPRERLPKPQKKQRRNSALISQSGAFMISRISKNPWLDPAYMTALGNQSDITHGDMLNYYADNGDIDIIGVYVEGFNELDGLNFARAVRKAVCNGKQVVVYKAGRTAAGAIAALGHTASKTGDYQLCKTILIQAGAMLADSFTEFDDLFYIADRLHGKVIGGNRLAAVSGAGFETVGMADSIAPILTMAAVSDTLRQRLEDILIAKRLDALMEVRNPIDINPGADDEAHVQCTAAFADDAAVDAVIVGLDPLSPAMRSLEQCARPNFDIHDKNSIVQLLPKLVDAQDTPIIGVVDGGPLYDAMCEQLMDNGVCTFRSCERAVVALARYTESRLRAERIALSQG